MQLNQRNRLLRHLAITEGLIRQYKSLGHEEAMWRLNHEHKMQIAWAKERYEFLKAEIDTLLPPKPKRRPDPNQGPIVSHRTGRPNSPGGAYGEKFG